jgi:hypothetical protein
MKLLKSALVAAIVAALMFAAIGIAHPRVVVRPRGAVFIDGAWYAPDYAPVYMAAPGIGWVVIEGHYEKHARIYIDGWLAGYAGELKHFALPVGPHEIELRDYSGHVLYHDRIRVFPREISQIRLA